MCQTGLPQIQIWTINTFAYNQLHWLAASHSQRTVYKTLSYVYKSMKGLSSQYIQDYLTVKQLAGGATRICSFGRTNFVIPVATKCNGDRPSFFIIAPQLWNILFCETKNATSQQSFKSMLNDDLFPWLFSFIFCISFVVIIFNDAHLCLLAWKRRGRYQIFFHQKMHNW